MEKRSNLYFTDQDLNLLRERKFPASSTDIYSNQLGEYPGLLEGPYGNILKQWDSGNDNQGIPPDIKVYDFEEFNEFVPASLTGQNELQSKVTKCKRDYYANGITGEKSPVRRLPKKELVRYKRNIEYEKSKHHYGLPSSLNPRRQRNMDPLEKVERWIEAVPIFQLENGGLVSGCFKDHMSLEWEENEFERGFQNSRTAFEADTSMDRDLLRYWQEQKFDVIVRKQYYLEKR